MWEVYSRAGDRQNDTGLQSSKVEAVERPAPAVTRLQPVVQAKLSVGPADDVYEREADAIGVVAVVERSMPWRCSRRRPACYNDWP